MVRVINTALFFLLVTYSCQTNEIGLTETIDLTNGLSMKGEAVLMSEFSDSIEYIFLETTDACLIDAIDKIMIDDSLIFIFNKKQLLIFNVSGKFERSIGKVGKGPGEYLEIIDFTINSRENKIYILDVGQQKVIRYSYDGEFELEFEIESWPYRITSNNDENLILVWVKPNYLLNDNYGFSIYSMDGELIGHSFNRQGEKADNREPSTLLSRLNYYSDSLTYWEINLDTIYRIDKYGEPWPRYKIAYERGRSDEKPGEIAKRYFRYSYFMETDKYLFFLRGTYNNQIMHVIYNKETHEFIKPYFEHQDLNLTLRTGFINNVDGGFPFLPYDALKDGRLYCSFYPYELKSLVDDGVFKNVIILNKQEQEYLYSKVLHSTAIDNPVIMLVTCN